MAKIPVEKDKGTPWWLWLLLLLLVVGAIWVLLALLDDEPDDDVVAVAPQEQVETVPVAGVITDIGAILNAEDPASLVGRRVELDNLEVQALSGDSTFYVSSEEPGSADGRILAVLEDLGESQLGAAGSDGRYNVDPNDMITATGTVASLGSNSPDTWGLSGTDAQELSDRQVYLRVDRLTFESRAQ